MKFEDQGNGAITDSSVEFACTVADWGPNRPLSEDQLISCGYFHNIADATVDYYIALSLTAFVISFFWVKFKLKNHYPKFLQWSQDSNSDKNWTKINCFHWPLQRPEICSFLFVLLKSVDKKVDTLK